jgi:hypothetical protein
MDINLASTVCALRESHQSKELVADSHQVNNIGPQTKFPVPEGVLNHHSKNFIGLTLWATDAAGAKLESFDIEASSVIQSGYSRPAQAPQPGWSQRHGAY